MKKRYIILGNGLDWCELSLHGIDNREDYLFFNSKLPLDMNKFSSKVARYYFSNTLNRLVDLPFKWMWYPYFHRKMMLDATENQVLVVYDKNMLGCNKRFLVDLRKNYPNLKIVYVFTNIVKYSGAKINKFVTHLKSYYDLVLAFDPMDAERYGFEYSPLVYNADNKFINKRIDNQVFYIGTAKDRLQDILRVYKRLVELGIKCDFNIAEVNEKDVDNGIGIVFNKRRPYGEVLERISKSECLLDIIQGNSSGLTIKTCEAICYDKKLITTNAHVAEYPFYNPDYIRIIKDEDDITRDFFDDDKKVHYRNEDKQYFSTDAFLNRIDNMLNVQGGEG